MASRTKDSMYKNEKLFRRMLDERTAGLLPDTDTESLRSDMTLGERDRNPNDEIPVPSPTAITATREELPVKASKFWFGYLQLIGAHSIGSGFVVSSCAF